MNCNYTFLNTTIRIRFCLLLLIMGTIAWSNYSVQAVQKHTYVGVIETKQDKWPDKESPTESETKTKKIVRVLFYKDQNEWGSLEKQISNKQLYPRKETWFIAYDGSNIGKFTSSFAPLRFSDPWTFPRDAYHVTKETSNIPTVGKPTHEYSGWSGIAYPRPLIVVSENNCNDPDKWKPYSPPSSIILSVRDDFVSYYKKLCRRYCRSEKTFGIRVLKSYKSNMNEVLLQLALYERPKDGNYTLQIWFYIDKEGNHRNLNSMVDELYQKDDFEDDDQSFAYLVDAGDYDGDGDSEIIFWFTRYDNDGYVLLYDDCSRFVKYCWVYH